MALELRRSTPRREDAPPEVVLVDQLHYVEQLLAESEDGVRVDVVSPEREKQAVGILRGDRCPTGLSRNRSRDPGGNPYRLTTAWYKKTRDTQCQCYQACESLELIQSASHILF